MGIIVGQISAKETGQAVPGALVTAFAVENGGPGMPDVRRRLGSVATNASGAFVIRHAQATSDASGRRAPWDLVVTVSPPHDTSGTEEGEAVLTTLTRKDAASTETIRFVIRDDTLAEAGLGRSLRFPHPDELIGRERALRERLSRIDSETTDRFVADLRDALNARERAKDTFSIFLDRLSSISAERRATRAHGYLPLDADIVEANLQNIRATIAGPLTAGHPSARAPMTENDYASLKERYGPDLEAIPVEAVEKLVWPWKASRPIRLINAVPLRDRCKPSAHVDDCVALLEGGAIDDGDGTTGPDEGSGASGSPGGEPSGGGGTSQVLDVPTLVHHQVDSATPPEVPVALASRANVKDIQLGLDSFVLESGPADAPAMFDFSHLQIAFEPLWHEVLDSAIEDKAHDLYDGLVDLGVDPNAYLFGPGDKLNLRPAKKATRKAAQTAQGPRLLAVTLARSMAWRSTPPVIRARE